MVLRERRVTRELILKVELADRGLGPVQLGSDCCDVRDASASSERVGCPRVHSRDPDQGEMDMAIDPLQEEITRPARNDTPRREMHPSTEPLIVERDEDRSVAWLPLLL